MKKLTAAILAAPLALAGLAADPAPAPACDDRAGREALTADGFALEFDAPAATAPELNTTADITGPAITPHRGAHFFFFTDLAPYDVADVTIDLTWTNPSDFDIFVSDSEGFELGRSANENIENGQVWSESLTLELRDCEAFTVRVASWAGTAAETLDLQLSVAPKGDPDLTESARTDSSAALYLGGDRPGTAGTLNQQAGAEELPFTTAMSADRPTGGMPNWHTRPAVGFNAHRNPFQPHWHLEFPVGEERDIVGDASALVWLSSQTSQDLPASFLVQLYVDGALVGESTVDGALVHPEPRPFTVEFPGLAFEDAFSVTLQVVTEPVISSSDPAPHDEPGELNHTVWYDSVQYQSRLILP